MNNKRIAWIDIIKFCCIFFVIASHCGNLVIAPLLRRFYTPFFLSGFLFASGYTFRFKEGFGKHFKKKVFQLLIPWFTFSTLTRLLGQLRHFGSSSFIEDMKWNFLQIRGLDDGMWFVAALFAAYIPFYFYIKSYEKEKKVNSSCWKKYLCISSGLMLFYYLYISFVPGEWFPWGKNALPWHIEYLPYAVFCMYLGYLVKERFEFIPDYFVSKAGSRFILYVVYVCLIFVPLISGIEFPVFVNCLMNCILTVMGILFITVIAKRIPPNAFFLYAGRNTVTYFGLQGKTIFVIETIMKKISATVFSTITAHPVGSIIYSLCMASVISLFLVIPAEIINRYFPFMLGRRRKK